MNSRPETETEMAQVARLQRDAGLLRLSRRFSWPEFCDDRRRLHQEFVYDVAMFAAARGFPWSDVVRAAAAAKCIFPQLDGLDPLKLLSLLREVLSECLPNLKPAHRHMFTQFLTHTCSTRRRLFQAVVGGAANISVSQLHLEVHLPPAPCPLSQGTELHEWEHQQQKAQLTSALQHKEEELRRLREGPRVTLRNIPEGVELDHEGVSEVVRAAVRATGGQVLESLSQEASLLTGILQLNLQLRLQQSALATGRLHNPVTSSTGHTRVHSNKGKNQNSQS